MRNTIPIKCSELAPHRARSRAKMWLHERRGQRAAAHSYGERRNQVLGQEIFEDWIGLTEQAVERLCESRELRDTTDRCETHDVEAQRAEER